jgi:hypothetical protein
MDTICPSSQTPPDTSTSSDTNPRSAHVDSSQILHPPRSQFKLMSSVVQSTPHATGTTLPCDAYFATWTPAYYSSTPEETLRSNRTATLIRRSALTPVAQPRASSSPSTARSRTTYRRPPLLIRRQNSNTSQPLATSHSLKSSLRHGAPPPPPPSCRWMTNQAYISSMVGPLRNTMRRARPRHRQQMVRRHWKRKRCH